MAEGVAGSPESGLKVSSSSAQDVKFGPFHFDAANGFVYRDGVALPLPPRALGVLAVLTARAGQVVSKQTLLEHVWKDTHVTDTSLAEAVSLLRQALGDDPQRGDFIQTVPRRGYRFVAPVEVPPMTAETTVRSAGSAEGALWTPWLPWVLAVLGGILLTSVVWSLQSRATVPRETIARFSIALPAGFQVADDRPALAFAPDSSAVAFAASRAGETPMLFVRSLADAASRPLAGTEGAEAPFFSPDARSIGYFAKGQLWRLDLDSGEPRALAAAPSPAGAVWTHEDVIIFGARWGEGLLRVSAIGGPTRAVTRIDRAAGDGRHAWPHVDASHGLLTYSSVRLIEGRQTSDVRGWSPPTLRSATLLAHASFSHVLSSDYLLAWRQSHPVVVRVDPSTLLVDNSLVVLPLSVRQTPDGVPLVAVSNRGAAVSVADRPPAGLAWITRDGGRADGPWPDRHTPLSLAADGVSLLAVSNQGGAADYWLVDLSRGIEQRLGARPTPAGSSHAFTRVGPQSGLDVVAERTSHVVARVETPADETAPALSPDEALIAWQSNASGEWLIALAPVVDVHAPQMVATGRSPAWSRDGRTLWFVHGDALMASDVDPATAQSHPARLVAHGVVRILGTAPDGRVLVLTRPAPATVLDVVLGWAEEVRARMDREPRLPRSFR
jgi:DNA-binding winged helix-turn-helix (wHTH) protein